MTSHLSEISVQYSSFIDDQVLTAEQLNQFLHYFEDQDRLTRTELLGTGLLCGFEPMINLGNGQITISQGTAVTTDGDLLKFRENINGSEAKNIRITHKTFTHFVNFTDDKANYPRFVGAGGPITMRKLLTAAEAAETSSASSLAGQNLNAQVLVLYLENYTKEADLCTTANCDNQGNLEVANLHVLLIPEAEVLATVNPSDTLVNQHNTKNTFTALPEVAIKRVMLNNSNVPDFAELKNLFAAAIAQVRSGLVSGMNALFAGYSQYLKAEHNLATISQLINNRLPAALPDDIQYCFDLSRDLADTYNEILELLPELKAYCNLDYRAFPKHILLGKISGNTNDKLRHSFYKTALIPSDYEHIAAFNSLMLRFKKCLEEFRQPSVALPTLITPSVLNAYLGKRSVPFYYQTSTSLLQQWDFWKSKIGKGTRHFAYERVNLFNADRYKNPLLYDLSDKDFYRIEGLHGKSFSTALSALTQQRKDFGLSFDIKLLSLNSSLETLNINDFKSQFADLELQLAAWKAEQTCLFNDAISFLSGFSTSKLGTHNYYRAFSKKASLTEASMASAPRALGDGEIQKVVKGQSKVIVPVNDTKKVSLQIADNEQDLGLVIVEVLKKTKYGSGADFEGLIIEEIRDKFGDFFVNNNEGKVQITIPASIISNIRALLSFVPDTVAEITPTLLNNFRNALDRLCQKVESSYEELNEIFYAPETKYTMVGFESIYMQTLSQLKETCCSGEYLELLLQETIDRKNEILESLKLSKFVEQHPGMEHLLGVPKGGTFILLYTGGNGPNADKVLADFCLPYRCCNGLAINFIVAEREIPANIKLSANEICVDTEVATAEMTYLVQPPEAEIGTINQAAGLSFEDGKLIIDTATFTLYNVPIFITLNGQDSGTSFIVRKKPKFSIAGSADQEVVTKGGSVTFTFSMVNENQFDASLHNLDWEFTDGTKASGATVSKTLVANDTIDGVLSLGASLTVGTGVCGNNREEIEPIEVEVREEVVRSISMSKTAFCNDDAAVPIQILPTDEDNSAFVVQGPGVQKLATGYQFNPTLAGVGTSTIILVGTTSNITVSVVAKPSGAFLDIPSGQNLISFEALATSSDGEYNWAIDGVKQTAKTRRIDFNITATKVLAVSLGFNTGLCGNVGSSRNISVRFENAENTCKDLLLNDLPKFLEELEEFEQSAIGQQLTDPQKVMIEELKNLGQKLSEDIDNFISGANNEQILALRTKLEELKRIILESQGDAEAAIAFYQFYLKFILNALHCQSEDLVKSDTKLIAMLRALRLHFDSNNDTSFPKRGIKMDESGRLKEFFDQYQAISDTIMDFVAFIQTNI